MKSVRAASAVSRSARVPAAASGCARSMSVLSSFPYTSQEFDTIVFPKVQRGLDYDLNWSLNADRVTTRGEAYRNASVRDLLEFAPRGSVKVTKERALQVVGGPEAAVKPAEAFATDVVPGRKVMDVEEYEGRLSSVRDECMSYAPRIFVEDAAVGSSRTSELRVRVVTDSPVVALYFRNLLHRTPLYSPEAFPRTLTVYAATLASDAISGACGMGPYTVVDVDPQSSFGTVLSVGAVPLASIAEAVAAAAGQLQLAGGYRSVPGGAANPAITHARKANVLHWYMQDRHYYAPKDEAHPDLLPVKGDVVLNADGKSYCLVVGAPSGQVAAAAASKGRLYSAHNAIWSASEGISSTWAGVSVPSASAKGLPVVRGALVAQGSVTLPLTGAKSVSHPSTVIVVGGGDVKTAAGVADKQADKLAARLTASGAKVSNVATAADAITALGL